MTLTHHTDPIAVLRFAIREGDTRLADLISAALRRELRIARSGREHPHGLIAPQDRAPGRARLGTPPSPLARRTLQALFALLGIDDANRRRP